MNDDNELTITDAVNVIDVILGKSPKQTINVATYPFKVDNSLVVGTWYTPNNTSFQFNEDGTTTFPGGATYEFMPILGRLLIYDAQKHPMKVLPLLKVESGYLLAVDYATNKFTYYTSSESLATEITFDQTSLAINSGTTAQLTATTSPESAFGSITWTSSDDNVATVDQKGLVTGVSGGTCTITATASGSQQAATCSVTVTQMVNNIKLSQVKTYLVIDTYVYLTATVQPENAVNKDVVWSSSDEDIASVTRAGKVSGNEYGTAIITCEAADGSGVLAVCEVIVSNTIDYPQYVDLGLPSGTLWASCNIGANSPEEYGDYYAWGETNTKMQYTDKNYSWWIYSSSGTGYSSYKFKKYYTGAELVGQYTNVSGTIDLKTELELIDDAAYVNCGSGWRIPSQEQFAELINSRYTTTEWTTLNDVSGYKITSNSNGNYIFLPLAGFLSGALENDVNYGRYWSRTLNPFSPTEVVILNLDSSDIGTSGNGGHRSWGLSVRPVRASE